MQIAQWMVICKRFRKLAWIVLQFLPDTLLFNNNGWSYDIIIINNYALCGAVRCHYGDFIIASVLRQFQWRHQRSSKQYIAEYCSMTFKQKCDRRKLDQIELMTTRTVSRRELKLIRRLEALDLHFHNQIFKRLFYQALFASIDSAICSGMA